MLDPVTYFRFTIGRQQQKCTSLWTFSFLRSLYELPSIQTYFSAVSFCLGDRTWC